MKRVLLSGTILAAALVAGPAFADASADQAMLNDAVYRPSAGVDLPKVEKVQLLLGVGGAASATSYAAGLGVHFSSTRSSLITAAGVALTSSGTTVPGGDTGAWARSAVYYLHFRFKCNPYMTALVNSVRATCDNGDFVGGQQGAGATEETQPLDHNFETAGGATSTNLRAAAANSAATGVSSNGKSCVITGSTFVLSSSDWHTWDEAVDWSGTGPGRLMAVYIDRTKVGAGGCGMDVGAQLVDFQTTLGWQIAWTAPSVWSNTMSIGGLYLDSTTSGGLDGSNNIPTATLNVFSDVSGNPKDPGANCINYTNGLGTGHTPQLCMLNGDKTDLTNHGTITNTWIATDVGSATVAAGPAPAHTAYIVGSPYADTVANPAATTLTTSGTTITSKAGNLGVLFENVLNASASTDRNVQCPSGWTQELQRPATAATFQSSTVCSHVYATDGEAANALTFTWTGSTGLRTVNWALVVIAGQASSSPIRDKQGADYAPSGSATTTTMAVPALTVATGDLVVDAAAAWDGAQVLGTPAGESSLYGDGHGGLPMVSWQRAASTGTLAARTITPSKADDMTGYSLSIKPN